MLINIPNNDKNYKLDPLFSTKNDEHWRKKFQAIVIFDIVLLAQELNIK